MGGEKIEVPSGSTKFGCEEKQRNGMLTWRGGVSKKTFFLKMSKVLEHVGMFLGKNSRKEEISDFRNERDNQKSKDPDYCFACLVS